MHDMHAHMRARAWARVGDSGLRIAFLSRRLRLHLYRLLPSPPAQRCARRAPFALSLKADGGRRGLCVIAIILTSAKSDQHKTSKLRQDSWPAPPPAAQEAFASPQAYTPQDLRWPITGRLGRDA